MEQEPKEIERHELIKEIKPAQMRAGLRSIIEKAQRDPAFYAQLLELWKKHESEETEVSNE